MLINTISIQNTGEQQQNPKMLFIVYEAFAITKGKTIVDEDKSMTGLTIGLYACFFKSLGRLCWKWLN